MSYYAAVEINNTTYIVCKGFGGKYRAVTAYEYNQMARDANTGRTARLAKERAEAKARAEQ